MSHFPAMEIIKNNRGGDKLCLDGYTYTKKNTKKNSIGWECSERILAWNRPHHKMEVNVWTTDVTDIIAN
jgi:hypothetical protein